MTKVNVLEALNRAMAHEMEQDPSVVILGEDVGKAGGIFRTTTGLQQRFGAERVIDTPLDEKGIAAHAIGMALYGLRPIVEIQFSGFIHDAFEQIMFCGAKYRWASGGQYSCPMVVRAPSYGGIKGGFWHSQSPESFYVHSGGMKIVAPSTPQDAYSLLLAAIRDPDPVLVLEPVPLYRAMSDDIALDGAAREIGPANKVTEGDDLTIVTWGPIRHTIAEVAVEIEHAEGVSIEIIDLCSLIPFDIGMVLASVKRTGRMLVIHEAPQSLGFGAELVALLQEKAFGYLKAPIGRVAAPDVPYHFSIGDEVYRPNRARIRQGILRTIGFDF